MRDLYAKLFRGNGTGHGRVDITHDDDQVRLLGMAAGTD
jgi:hypothetical protein